MGVPGSPVGFPRLPEAHGRITIGCPAIGSRESATSSDGSSGRVGHTPTLNAPGQIDPVHDWLDAARRA